MNRLIALVAMLAVWLTGAATAWANAPQGKRVALVIGNSAYQHAVNLPNPSNDARLMATTLRGAGFQIIEGLDLDRAGMNAAVDSFTEAAYDAEIALVYYAGHGLQVDGRNYIIPVDAELTSPAHLRTRAIEVDSILAALPPDPAVGVVILDACRDNPLARTLAAALPASRSSSLGQGLAPLETSMGSTGAGGVLIAYATDPGAVALDGNGVNSPYTTALARHLATPGLEIQSALTRVRGEVTEATLGRQRPWHNASIGREIFIGGEPKPAAQLSVTSVETPVDRGNESAIEQQLWDEVSKRDTVAHYEVYLAQFPQGRFAAIARLNMAQLRQGGATQVAGLSPAEAVSPQPGSQIRTAVTAPEEVRLVPGTPATDSALNLDRNARIDLQLRLVALGHEIGGVDGAIGAKSRAAIGKWQQQHGIVETTFLTAPQHSFLVVQTEPMMASVRAEYEARKASAARQQQQRQTTQRRQPANGNNNNKKGGGLGKAGAFAAGVAIGVVGCKLARC